MSTPRRGGKRPGAGRKSKYGEPTVTARVPVSLLSQVQALIDNATKSKTGTPEPVKPLQGPTFLEREPDRERCECETTTGGRCRGKTKVYLKVRLPGDQVAEFAACTLHAKRPDYFRPAVKV